jgi:EmrB/QacA subfamily drug resistance transporter
MSVATPLSPPAGSAAPARVHRTLALGIILAVQLMVVLDATIVNIALPGIAKDLHLAPAGLSWVITAYTLTAGGFLLLGARAGDLLGRKRVFMAGIGLFTASSLLGGLAPNSGLLIGARALQGLGGALAAPSALAFLMVMFPEGRERLRALGYYAAVSVGGGAVGLLLGGLLTQIGSWRWVLFVNVPVGVAVVFLAHSFLSETPRRRGHFDLLGALTATSGATSLTYGFVRAASNGWGDPLTVSALALGVGLLTLYVILERRAAEPITPLRLFADRARSASYGARLLVAGAMLGMLFFLTQFVQVVLRYSPLETGLAFLPFSVCLFATSQLSARRLTPRYGGRSVMVVGLSLSTLALLLMTRLSGTSSYLEILVPAVLFGSGNGLAFVPLTNASLAGVRPQDSGAASGLVNVTQQLGGALGLAVLVSIFGSAGAAVEGRSAAVARATFAIGADHVFAAASLIMGVTVLLLLAAVRGRRAETPIAAAAPEVPEWVRELDLGEEEPEFVEA